MYQPFQPLKKGALSLSGVCIIYLRVDRNQPVNTIVNPSTMPIKTPTFIRFIIKPSARPMAMAKRNETSALPADAFLFVLISAFLFIIFPCF
jgi:hypothetical protein